MIDPDTVAVRELALWDPHPGDARVARGEGTAVINSETCSCRVVPLKRIDEPRGSLCVAQVAEQVPFVVQRVYWVFDVPPGEERAHHAHREQDELLVALRGSFVVHSDNGAGTCVHVLDSPDQGLLLPAMVWHHLDQISADAVCLVLASGPFDPSEYVHSYEEFVDLVRRQ